MTKLRPTDTCDGYLGWAPDFCGAPVIKRCRKPAVEIVKTGRPGVFAEVFACADCAPYFRAKIAERPLPEKADEAGKEGHACNILEYDGAWKCYTHDRTWGAVTNPAEPCPGWSEADTFEEKA